MKKMKLALGMALATGMLTMFAGTAFAMPGDIEEAVNDPSYDSTQHQNGTATYADSDLNPVIDADYVANAYANIRTAPFGQIVGGTVPGQTYHVIGKCPDCEWYKISGEHYVYADYLVPASEYNGGTTASAPANVAVDALDMKMTVNAQLGLNARTAPSTDAQVVKTVAHGTEVLVTGKVQNADWYQVSLDGQTVYMSDDYLKPELPQTMSCTVDALNIRTGASMDAQVVGTLTNGEKVKVTADENGWLKFTRDDGSAGYVYAEYMAAVQ